MIELVTNLIILLGKIPGNVFKALWNFLRHSKLQLLGATISLIILFSVLFLYKENLYTLKFKRDLDKTPQTIDQNNKESQVFRQMFSYLDDCNSNGSFMLLRIGVVDKETLESQIKFAVSYLSGTKSFRVFSQTSGKDVDVILHKKYNVSSTLLEILLESKEGKVYSVPRSTVEGFEDFDQVLYPFSMLFARLSPNYESFRYVPIFHEKLGLIVIIGYLGSGGKDNCQNLQVESYLEELYAAYR